jgi:hypothetical protein
MSTPAARLLLIIVIIAGGLALLSGCQTQTPAAATAPAASSADLLDQDPACTDAMESEVDKAASDGRTGTFAITVPPSCSSLSHAQIQALAGEISADYAQGQAFANAFRQALAQLNGSGGQAS